MLNFAHYFFESYTDAEINANQISSYIINFNSSKKFVRELDNLHVRLIMAFLFIIQIAQVIISNFWNVLNIQTHTKINELEKSINLQFRLNNV